MASVSDYSFTASENKYSLFWDAFGFCSPYSGIYQYASNLANEFADTQTKPIPILAKSETPPAFPYVNTVCVAAEQNFISQKFKILWIKNSFETVRNHLKNDENPFIFHGLANMNIPGSSIDESRGSYVLTVHDLIPLLAPRQVSLPYFLQFSYLLPRALKKATKVICVSSWTARTIEERYPWSRNKIEVVKNGVSLPKNYEGKGLGERKNEKSCKILFISRWEPYKRFEIIDEILKKTKNIHLDLVTDSVGAKFFQSKRSAYENRIRIYVNLSKEELLELYIKNDVYVHPSLLEGFCLPACDALKYQRPVVYCQGSAVEEVVGPCGLGISPQASVDEWINAIEAVKEWKRQDLFINNLQKHLNLLPSWKDSSLKIKAIYDKIVDGSL